MLARVETAISGNEMRRNFFQSIGVGCAKWTGTAGGSMEAGVPGGSGSVDGWSGWALAGVVTLICGARQEGQKGV